MVKDIPQDLSEKTPNIAGDFNLLFSPPHLNYGAPDLCHAIEDFQQPASGMVPLGVPAGVPPLRSPTQNEQNERG